DHFLSLLSVMPGRDVHDGATALAACPVTAALEQLREAMPLRERLKRRGQELANGQELLRQGLAAGDGKLLGEALALADPAGPARGPLAGGRHEQALGGWVGGLFQSDDPFSGPAEFWQPDPVPAAGLWLPAAVLHLRDAQHFVPFCAPVRHGLARL